MQRLTTVARHLPGSRNIHLRRSFSTVAWLATTHAITMPQPPLLHRTTSTSSALNLDDVAAAVSEAETRKQEAYDLGRHLQVALVKAKHAAESGQEPNDAKVEALIQQVTDLQPADHLRTPRPANLSSRMEDYVRYRAYRHFVATGRLLAPLPSATDEEYLGGACMGLAQDLQRYGLAQATARDTESVQAATDLVSDMLDYLLQLDFRNGPLRRKYDGTKYALKALETLLYELAVTSSDEQPAKRQRTESLLPDAELQDLQARMVDRDELREALIKKCRDGQKAAKQSIFALHRGDVKKAADLMEQCRTCIQKDLWPIVEQEPPLRQGGSLTGVLEEYVEAKLFATWLYGSDLQNPTSTPSGALLKPADFDIDLTLDEFFGGLCDLTGEIGRYAVACGTARDTQGVKLCLETNGNIWYALQTMERLPGGIGKKLEPLRRSVEKLERMLYEMSLSEAAGGRNVQTGVESARDGDMDES